MTNTISNTVESEDDRLLISIQEAARRLGVSSFTIRAWIEKGRLEAFRVEEITGFT